MQAWRLEREGIWPTKEKEYNVTKLVQVVMRLDCDADLLLKIMGRGTN